LTLYIEVENVPCELCGADEPELLFTARDTLCGIPGVFRIVRCQLCRLVYLNPRPKREMVGRLYPAHYYDLQRSPIWDPKSNATESWVRQTLRALYYRLAGRLSERVEELPVGRVLDVGCGDGSYLLRFKKRGWEVWGIDPSATAITRAGESGLNARLGELPEIQLPEAYFDLVLLRYTLENMHNPTEVLRAARRALRDDGKLFISAPSISCPAARALRQYSAYIDAPRHLFFFDRSTIESLLSKCHFRVVEAARIPCMGLFKDVFTRLTGGRFRRVFERTWVSWAVWITMAPWMLGLAWLGANRGNLELICEKRVNGGSST